MHSKKTYLLVILCLILALSIPAVQLRLTSAASQIDPPTIVKLSGCYGTMLTRNGEVLYDGKETKVPELSNLIGGRINGVKVIENSLTSLYEDQLLPRQITAVSGYHGLKGLDGKRLTTTLLSPTAQSLLAQRLGEHKGSIFAYNYVTGEVYTSMSIPSSLTTKEPNSLMNTPIKGTYIPGSTMKIPTIAVALSQQPELINHKHACDGEFELADGKTIKCHSIHGTIDFVTAIGKSCNCYFASLITQFNILQAIEDLQGFGFTVNKQGGATRFIDKFKCASSSTNFANTDKFQDVWALIGQGDTRVNPANMAMLAGAVANGGQAAQPYIIENIQDPNHEDYYPYKAETQKINLISKDAANAAKSAWEEAVSKHYKGYNSNITMVKTGTAQTKGGTNRLLLGAITSKQTAFYIVVENTADAKYMIDIANTLVQVLPSETR